MSDDKVALMVSMGFDQNTSAKALALTDGNVDHAVDRILSGQVDTAAATTDSGNSTGAPQNLTHVVPTKVVTTDTSQYSIPNGRSACTAFALHTVSKVLPRLENENIENVVTSDELNTLLFAGVSLYNTLQSQMTSNVEHSSAEELLLLLPDQAGLRLIGGVRQGILTGGPREGGPMGFKAILESCRSECDRSKWMGAVITKSPESICIFLPPQNEAELAKSNVIIDSHPRPSLNIGGCNGSFYSTLEALVSGLSERFPAVDLGSDVPEMMAAMYNSFDVYAFQC